MASLEEEKSFEGAVQQLIRTVGRDCQYRPTEYIRVAKRYGGLGAAKFLLIPTEPISYDSLRIASKGRRDLTIEALVCDQEWSDLFDTEERELAQKRYILLEKPFQSTGEASTPTDAARLGEPPDADAIIVPNVVIPTNVDVYESQPLEDDIAWGEELVEAVGVCQKLSAMEAGLAGGDRSWNLADWVIPVVRDHLEVCTRCSEHCALVRAAIEEHEEGSLKILRSLLPQCGKALNWTEEKARQLLSREWKAADFAYLPSEFEELGLDWEQFKWKDPSRPEWLQLSNWIDLLAWRAVQFCRHVGGLMLQCEDTQEFSPISGVQVAGDAGLWLDWRKTRGGERIRAFVEGLSRTDFSTALVARGVAAVFSPLPMRQQLVLPGGDDLSSVEGSAEIKDTTEPSDWEAILGRRPVAVDCRALLELACGAADKLVGLSDPLQHENRNTIHSTFIPSSSVTADELGQLGRGLRALLDWVEDTCTCEIEDVKKRVDRLMSQGRLPREMAVLMHTVREYRNMSEHGHVALDQSGSRIVRLAWERIASWAVSQGWSPLDARW